MDLKNETDWTEKKALEAIKSGGDVPEIWLDYLCAKACGENVRIKNGEVCFKLTYQYMPCKKIDANFLWPYAEKIGHFPHRNLAGHWEYFLPADFINGKVRNSILTTGKTAMQAVKRLLIFKGIK